MQKDAPIQGWIDTLIKTESGYIVLDHKSYPGRDPLKKAREYLPQLKVYREAVQQSTGEPVTDTLIHFPVLGLIVRADWPS